MTASILAVARLKLARRDRQVIVARIVVGNPFIRYAPMTPLTSVLEQW